MAGSYGAESTRGEWYRLSFTVGGLLASQGRALAEMYLDHVGCSNAGCSSQTEVGESIVVIRSQAIEENVLAIRTDSANRRVVAETTKRLSALTVRELAYLAGPDSSISDREALMWIASAGIMQSSGNSLVKCSKSIILPAIRIWTLRIMIGSLRTKPHGILNWKP